MKPHVIVLGTLCVFLGMYFGFDVSGLANNADAVERADALSAQVEMLRETVANQEKQASVLQERYEKVMDGWANLNKVDQGVLKRMRGLAESVDEVHWDIDDVRIMATPPVPGLDQGSHPENTVVVSKTYPEIGRLPYGVKIDDQRPPENRDRVIYMAIDLGNGFEKRIYPPQVTWKEPKESDLPPAEPAEPAAGN